MTHLALVDVLVLVLRIEFWFGKIAGVLEVTHTAGYSNTGHWKTSRYVCRFEET